MSAPGQDLPAGESSTAAQSPQIISAPVDLAPELSGTSPSAHPGRSTSRGPPISVSTATAPIDAPPSAGRQPSTEDKDTLSPLAGYGLSSIPTRSTATGGSYPSQALSTTATHSQQHLPPHGAGAGMGGGASQSSHSPATSGMPGASSSSGTDDRGETGAGLKSWWKGFRERDGKAGEGSKGKARGGSQRSCTDGSFWLTWRAVWSQKHRRNRLCSPCRSRRPCRLHPCKSRPLGPRGRSTSGAIFQSSLPSGELSDARTLIAALDITPCFSGLHLKETATEVQGTFRVSGSAKRMKELQAIFETPPKVGHPGRQRLTMRY